QSGRRLLGILQELQQPQPNGIPPIEKNLWKAIWKIRAPPKLKHFLWRVLSGAVPVKERLNSRGLQLDSRCSLCHGHSESICHLLFSCPFAKEVWNRSGVQLPAAGFSSSSVFLNVYHLICVNGRRSHHKQNRIFPWVMWQVWKARNILHFEKTQTSSEMASSKAIEDADAWFDANFCEQSGVEAVGEGGDNSTSWCPPPVGVVKCNVGVSWSGSNLLCGASWIIRNHDGMALLHSRRTFKNVRSKLEAELTSLCWVVESLAALHYTNVIIESNCTHAREALIDPTRFPWFQELTDNFGQLMSSLVPCSVEHVITLRNKVAEEIAISVTRDSRYQSYVALGGPRWLINMLEVEARGAVS
ncbi:unnamed protein product, partial [Brassica rapa subsp. narinosa]